MSKPEYMSKNVAAKHLALSVRRLLEISAEGELKRHYVRDPRTRRKQTVFKSADVLRIARTMHKQLNGLAVGHPQMLEGAAPAAVSVAIPALPPPPPAASWLTLKEAEAHIGLPAAVLWREIQQGRLAAMDVGVREGGRWRVHREDLDALRGKVQGRASKGR